MNNSYISGENMVESDIILSNENLPNLCRLCLQVDDFIVDIFHRLDPNPHKKPLPERIFDLYQVKVDKFENLPTNICHRCLYFTESFTEFRDNVRKCEARLQRYSASVAAMGTHNLQDLISSMNGIKTENDVNLDNVSIIVVDPNQEYESSNDDFSLDSEDEYAIHQLPQIKKTLEVQNEEIESGFSFHNFECIDNSDSIKNVFLCQYCDMAFTSQIECAEHESRHDAANPHSCNYCPFRCSNRQTVISHIKELHDSERPFVCTQCNKTFGRRSDLKKHTTVHTGIRPFTCPVCGKNFSRNTNLTKHLRIHTSHRPFVCQKCPRSFTTSEDLRRHTKVHSNQKMHQCSKCSSRFTRKDKLAQHELTHENKEQHLGNEKLSYNQETHKTKSNEYQNNKQMLAENMIISLNPFTDLNQVGNIGQNITTQPTYSALMKPQKAVKKRNVTGKKTKPTTSLEASDKLNKPTDNQQKEIPGQKRKREIRRNFICPVCQKAFLRRRELLRHSIIHTGIKPFPCQYCPKRFSRKDKATKHEKTHLGNNYSCSKCELIFSNQEALNTHSTVHEHEEHHQQSPFPLQQMMQMPTGQQTGMQHNPMNPMPPTFQGFQQEYKLPQLNFYNEIQPEN